MLVHRPGLVGDWKFYSWLLFDQQILSLLINVIDIIEQETLFTNENMVTIRNILTKYNNIIISSWSKNDPSSTLPVLIL